jgi:hypothetical protein
MDLTADIPARFHFVNTEVDLPPAEPGQGVVVRVSGGMAWHVPGVIRRRHAPLQLPPPSPNFREPEELREIRGRLRDLRMGRDRLLAVGAYAREKLFAKYGGKKEAPERMNVDQDVFDTLTDPTGERIHPVHGRKGIRDAPQLQDDEATWVRAAIVALAVRMGELEAGASPSPLTMADLPPLGSAGGLQGNGP